MNWKRISTLAVIMVSIGLAGCKGGSGGGGGGGGGDGDGQGKPTEPKSFELHYRLSNMSGMNLEPQTEGTVLNPLDADGFGQRFQIRAAADRVRLALKRGTETLALYDIDLGKGKGWIFGESSRVYDNPPPAIPEKDKEAVVYYTPFAPEDLSGQYLHVWNAVSNQDWTNWNQPIPFTVSADSEFGAYVKLKLPSQPEYSANPSSGNRFPNSLGLVMRRQPPNQEKALGGDVKFNPNENNMIFLSRGSAEKFCTPDLKPCGFGAGFLSHLVSDKELLMYAKGKQVKLIASADGAIDLANIDKQLADPAFKDRITEVSLSAGQDLAPSAATKARFPHLAAAASYKLPANVDLKKLVKSELIAVVINDAGLVESRSPVHTQGILDQVFATPKDMPLGLVLKESPELRLWAPTAQSVSLQVFNSDKSLLKKLDMTEGEHGVWSIDVPMDWVKQRLYYKFALKVFIPTFGPFAGSTLKGTIADIEATDPYAFSLSADGRFAQFVDIEADDLKPQNWQVASPSEVKPTELSFYELHVRDYSSRVKPQDYSKLGKYLAFADKDPDSPIAPAREHLRKLQKAGITHIQLLPVYDLGSVPETPSQVISEESTWEQLCAKPDFVSRSNNFFTEECKTQKSQKIEEWLATQDQAAADFLVKKSALYRAMAPYDAYNWGYDPVHYGVPDGSYAMQADGAQRILEFRAMVQGLHEMSLKVALDVVYNHTYEAALGPYSVLDRVVPGYYYRLNEYTGALENATCCSDTASENIMMEKLMIDTLKRWKDHYGVDAFRFDLMGYHMLSNMQEVRKVLGDTTYFYGEGWDTLASRRGLNATQYTVAGVDKALGIGTFNDRLRNAIWGGGTNDCSYYSRQQGVVSGLLDDLNEIGGLPANGNGGDLGCDPNAVPSAEGKPASERENRAKTQLNVIRMGLMGTLKGLDIPIFDGEGTFASSENRAFGLEAYASQPSEVINYAENHDNRTLWDMNLLKLPFGVKESTSTREPMGIMEKVRVQNLGNSLVLLSQGIPYFDAGTEILRSKALERDSYDSGDILNGLDYTLETDNWGLLAPFVSKDPNSRAYRELDPLLLKTSQFALSEADRALGKAARERAFSHFLDFLAVRRSSPLFSLRTVDQVKAKVKFDEIELNQKLGVVAMTLDDVDCKTRVDDRYQRVLVVFNFLKDEVKKPVSGSRNWVLHPILVNGGGTYLGSAAAPKAADVRLTQVKVKSETNGTASELTIPGRTTAVFVEARTQACL